MAFYIRDDAVRELADEVRKLAKSPNRTEAVRVALMNERDRLRSHKTMREKIEDRLKNRHLPLPKNRVPFDQKEFSDSLWDD